MKNPRLIATVAGVASFGAGLVVGYKVAEKRLGAQFEKRIEEEISDMREFYTNVKQKYETPEEAAAALIPDPEPIDPRVKTQRVQYNKIVKQQEYDGLAEFAEKEPEEGCEIDKPEVVTQNVFEMNADPNGPYIISQEEFMANETGYEQATLTFYVADETLSDQRDEIIENRVDVIGPISDVNFGEGSSDSNTVHVRNPKLQMEFEVVRSERSYAEDVLGEETVMETPNQRVRRDG